MQSVNVRDLPPDTRYTGAPIRRREDPRLITGHGRYVADIRPRGCLEAAFLRSPHAHARLGRIEPAPGGDVFTAADLPEGLNRLHTPPLATTAVHWVGQPVAVAVAPTRYAAEDRLERLAVAYEPLPPVLDLEAALAGGSPLAREGTESNLAQTFEIHYGDTEAAFAAADLVVRQEIVLHRAAGHPMEGRGIVCLPDADTGGLMIWAAHQSAHRLRAGLSAALGLGEHQIRVRTPDVGGGFGIKNDIHPEDVATAWLALRLARPVRWIEDRREHFLAAAHEREQVHHAEIAARADGTLLAFRDHFVCDTGPYGPRGFGIAQRTVLSLPGPYRLPTYEIVGRVAYTNKAPTGHYRGAGRPQANFVMERMIDRLADEAGIARAELRRKNLITATEMPYTTGIPADRGLVVYDSGDYPACLERVLTTIGDSDLTELRRREGARGRCVGLGVACYNEDSGGGPFESARVRIDPQGRVVCHSGAPAQGQGHETVYAQMLADELGVHPDDVTVVASDTAGVPLGIGTFGSRGLPTGGAAVVGAGRRVREKVLRIAAHLLEASPDDLEVVAGRVRVKGAPARGMTVQEIARVANTQPGRLPAGTDPGIEETFYFQPAAATYANGANACIVAVDPATGQVEVLRYVIAHDCGRLINPLLVEGQIHGGEMYGLSMALLEELVHDESGQLVTASFMDYLLPTAVEVPRYEVEHLQTPTPLNPMGAKGAGEGGTIPAPAAIVAAVEDALSSFGVRIRELPVTPVRLRRLVEAGSSAGA